MPLVTMGGMRLQQTWVPDTTPAIGIRSMSGIAKACQDNFVACIRRALSHGINHFETGGLPHVGDAVLRRARDPHRERRGEARGHHRADQGRALEHPR